MQRRKETSKLFLYEAKLEEREYLNQLSQSRKDSENGSLQTFTEEESK